MNIFTLFDHLPPKAKAILLGAIAKAIASTPACIAVIVANSGSISVKHQDTVGFSVGSFPQKTRLTEISLQGKTKALVNEAEYSNKILQQRLGDLEAEINKVKSPQLAGIKESFAELKPTAETAIAE